MLFWGYDVLHLDLSPLVLPDPEDFFSTTIDKILSFMGPHKMKMSNYFG